MFPSSLLLLATVLTEVAISQDYSQNSVHIFLIIIREGVGEVLCFHTKDYSQYSTKSFKSAEQTEPFEFGCKLRNYYLIMLGLKEHHPVDELAQCDAFFQEVVVDVYEKIDGIEGRRQCRNLNTCLLYTSPSPRD